VPAPPPVDDGSFYVHIVRQSDETFPKILTWYTGTTLSGSLVARFNPYLQQRDVKVGDRVVIPLELVANDQPYGTAPAFTQKEAPNLLMEDKPREAPPKKNLETFDDDTNPMVSATPVEAQSQRREELEREIRERQAELDRLKQRTPAVEKGGDEELPYDDGESF
jgi:hypothetical protein